MSAFANFCSSTLRGQRDVFEAISFLRQFLSRRGSENGRGPDLVFAQASTRYSNPHFRVMHADALERPQRLRIPFSRRLRLLHSGLREGIFLDPRSDGREVRTRFAIF